MPQEPKMRSAITGGPEGLEIVIPARRNIFAVMFLGVWLIGWLMGEIAAIGRLTSMRGIGSDLFLLLWLTLWTIGGSVAAYTWLWMLAGKERILMGASTLRVKRDVLGFGPTRLYDLPKLRNLRVSPLPAGPRDMGAALRLWGFAGGLIAFEYGGKTIRFGAAIDESEGQMIVERMKQRYAFPETSAAPVEPPQGRGF